MSFKFPKINHEEIKKRFKENLDGNTNQTSKDDRFYVMTKKKDPAGKTSANGSSVIRFLPGKVVKGAEQLQYISLFRHQLQIGKGPAMSVVCPTTIGGKCPICEWNRACEDGFAKKHSFWPYRKAKYISNIMVLEEDKKELINKVMLFEYGKQIMNILESSLYPKKVGSRKKEPLLYYDWEAGANFDLVLVHEAPAFPTWDNSEFLAPSSIMEIVEERGLDPEEIVNGLYDLESIVDSLGIKSYNDLQTELYTWLDANNLPVGGQSAESALENENRAHALQNSKKSPLASAVTTMRKEEMENSGTESDLDEVANKYQKKTKAVSEVSEEKKDGEGKFKDFRSFMKSDKGEEEE